MAYSGKNNNSSFWTFEKTILVSAGLMLLVYITVTLTSYETLFSSQDGVLQIGIPSVRGGFRDHGLGGNGGNANVYANDSGSETVKEQSSLSALVSQINFPDTLSRNQAENNENSNENNHTNKNKKVGVSLSRIPFPQSVQNEEWETILHPAVVMANHASGKDTDINSDKTKESNNKHDDETLQVPKFWNPKIVKASEHQHDDIRHVLGNYGERLPTPQEMAIVGTYTTALYRDDHEDSLMFHSTIGGNDDDKLKFPNIIKTKDIIVKPAEDDRYYYEESRERDIDTQALLQQRNRSLLRQQQHNTTNNQHPIHPSHELETIFISIASYRDFRCPATLISIFQRATFPERIRVAIVDQIDSSTDTPCVHPFEPCTVNPNQIPCLYSQFIDSYVMDASLAVGPVFARHIGHRMYRGEYFAMQTDAHMEFVEGWDVDVINQWKSAKNEMAVLTTYVSDVYKHFDETTGKGKFKGRPYMCKSDFDEDYYSSNMEILVHGQQPEDTPDVQGEPTLEPFWAAGFSFARGHFIVQVPYDQYLPMIFQGEEISIGLRGFTYGYDYYAPERSVIYHYYNTHRDGTRNKEKKKVATFWENADRYNGLENWSKARLEGIIQMLPKDAYIDEEEVENVGKTEANTQHSPILWNRIDEQKYGIGRIRTIQKFLDTFGIHLEEKRTEQKLCQFVGAPMQHVLTPHLRPNGMGIDYDKVTYQFKDSHAETEGWIKYYVD